MPTKQPHSYERHLRGLEQAAEPMPDTKRTFEFKLTGPAEPILAICKQWRPRVWSRKVSRNKSIVRIQRPTPEEARSDMQAILDEVNKVQP